MDADVVTFEIGKRYAVKLSDCCVRATFTATLTGMGPPMWEGGLPDWTEWDNGVRLGACLDHALDAELA